MVRFEPGQLIVAARPSPMAGVPLLILSAVLNKDKATWTVEFVRDKKVVTSKMHPAFWHLLQDPM